MEFGLQYVNPGISLVPPCTVGQSDDLSIMHVARTGASRCWRPKVCGEAALALFLHTPTPTHKEGADITWEPGTKTLILSWFHICAEFGKRQPHSCLPHLILPELLKITMASAGFGCLGDTHALQGGSEGAGGEHEVVANPLISPREADVKC